MEKKAPLLLSMDTATPSSSVALTIGTQKSGAIVASLCLGGKVTHSRRLLGAIEYLMEQSEIGWADLDGIAVSSGPGSFTGLRIGMATAKGLAVAAKKSLFGVSTLDGLAARCTTTRLICPLLDARKKEVYTAFYLKGTEDKLERISDYLVISPGELAKSIDRPVVMLGDGVDPYQELFRDVLGDKVFFGSVELGAASATSIGLLAGELWAKEEELDLASAVPLYVRSSDAELNLQKKMAQMVK